MRRLAIIGSTGSIGSSALEVVAMFPEEFSVEVLAAGDNLKLLRQQIRTFYPRFVSVRTQQGAMALREEFPGLEVGWGEEGLKEAALWPEADLVLLAVAGSVGLSPAFAALEGGKDLALATKEVLVMAGGLIMEKASEVGRDVLPVDSEHSAIFQAMGGKRGVQDLRKIILTASGGPFYSLPKEKLSRVRPEEAIRHPVWKMGRKISVDSATLMNKGLEVIEAHWFFRLPPERIEVLIHPQGIVHSLIEFTDGSMLAQLSVPDMRIPIAYALAYPRRLPLPLPRLDLSAQRGLTFHPPDLERFPALRLAFEAAKAGGTLPAVLNAADEVAVKGFLQGRIGFDKITEVVERVMERHHNTPLRTLQDAIAADRWAREEAEKAMEAI